MASYNRIIMIGNLTRDPEYKQVSSGQAVCRFGLASNRQFKNRQTGTAVQEVCFVDIDVWGPQAESCNQYLSKGRPVLVEGRLKFDSWQDPDGNRRSKHSIVADRVTFLSAGAQPSDEADSAGFDSSASFEEPSSSLSPAKQIKDARSAAPVTKKTARKSTELGVDTGELDFKDEKPFSDDLPF